MTNSSITSGRIYYIDIAKCFAIISVVVCHVLLMDLYSFHDIWNSPLMKFVSSYQMPLFMFLSGLVSMTVHPKNGIIRDIIKRIQQLVVPFIIVASIFSLWKDHSLGFVFDTFKWGYWYLWVLFVYYIFSYPLNGGGKKIWFRYLFGLAIWFVATRVTNRFPEIISNLLSLELIVKYFPYFLMGNIIKRYQLHDKIFDNYILLYASIIIWMCSSLFSFHYGEYIVSCAVVLIIMQICKRMDSEKLKINKLLIRIGQSTLYIYIFHYFAIELMVTNCFQSFLASASCIFIDLLIATLPVIAAISFSLVLKWILEKDRLVMKYVFGKKA